MNPLPTTPEQVKEELQSLAGHGPAAPILIRLFEIGLKCGKPLPIAYQRVLLRYLKFIERSNAATSPVTPTVPNTKRTQ